jgi:POT family proton-dependent oligopeptide transporter
MASTLPADLERDSGSRHPVGLYALFGTEMWERLSYYGMRALLVLYLTKALGYDRQGALGIYAVYTGLVYLTPLIGGRLADRYLGQRKAVFIGGILMAMGQFALTQPALLSLGLGLLIIGNGFFKPNISTMVGGLYPQGDHRRDGAYTIFYMGINLGAFLAPVVCGTLGENVGWGYGFASAGVGMILGILTFVFTQRVLQGVGLPPGRTPEPRARLNARDWVDIALIAALAAGLVYAAIAAWPTIRPVWAPPFLQGAGPELAGIPILAALWKGFVLVAVLGLFLWATEPRKAGDAAVSHEKLTGEDWQRMVVILIISLFSIVFWAGFEQSGGTLNLFADEEVNRGLGRNGEIPTSWLQAVNPLFIFMLAPLFAVIWTTLAYRRIPLSSFAKQGLGLILLGVGFGVMYLADSWSSPSAELKQAVAAAREAAGAGGAGGVLLPAVEGKSERVTVGARLDEAAEAVAANRLPFNALRESHEALKDSGQAAAAGAVETALGALRSCQVSPLWLILVYFIFTVAELFISPIGLSLVNKLAPAKLASLMMALWFLCTAAANYLAGITEHLIEPYHWNLWVFLGLLAAVPGVLMLVITPLLERLSHGRS